MGAVTSYLGSLPLTDFLLPTPETYTILLNVFQYFPLVSAIQWLTSWHPAGKTSSLNTSWLNLPGRLGWFLMEIVGPVNLVYILWKLPPMINIASLPLSNKLVALAYLLHYVNRAIISPFFAAPSMSPMHVFIVAAAMLFNWLNSSCLAAWLVGYHIPVPGYKTDGAVSGPLSTSPLSYSPAAYFLPCLGTVLFVTGMIGNIHSERTLFRLRREAAEKNTAKKTDNDQNQTSQNKNKYSKIYVIPPPTGVFRSILYPHYVFEWIEWLGFALLGVTVFPSRQAIIAGSYASPPIRLAPWLVPAAALSEKLQVPLPLPAIVFAVNAVANMLPHARWGRKWYVEKFGEKAVGGRGAALPWCPWM